MPLGVRAKGQHFGIQYCPCCLIEDQGKPYFRRYWRLAFLTCCPFHSTQLKDCCPNCEKPIDLKHLHKQPKSLILHPMDIAYCSQCNFDLRMSPYLTTGYIEQQINNIHFSLYQNGYGQVGNQIFQYSNLYFEGARRLLSFLVGTNKGRQLSQHILKQHNMLNKFHFGKIQRQSELETIRLHERKIGIICLYWLMLDWPDSFVKNCKELGIFKQNVFSGWLEYPYWINDAITFRIKRLHEPRSHQELNQAIKYLETKLKRKVQTYEINRITNKTPLQQK